MSSQHLCSSEQIQSVVSQIPYLKMLVLFGSRARGDNHPQSDWDFAVLYDKTLRQQLNKDKGFASFEIYAILEDIFQIFSENIDVVNLNQCSNLTAHYVARDGKLLYEKEPGLFEQFKQSALMSPTQLNNLRQIWEADIEQFLQEQGV